MNIFANIFLKHGYFLLIETKNPDWSWQLFLAVFYSSGQKNLETSDSGQL